MFQWLSTSYQRVRVIPKHSKYIYFWSFSLSSPFALLHHSLSAPLSGHRTLFKAVFYIQDVRPPERQLFQSTGLEGVCAPRSCGRCCGGAGSVRWAREAVEGSQTKPSWSRATARTWAVVLSESPSEAASPTCISMHPIHTTCAQTLLHLFTEQKKLSSIAECSPFWNLSTFVVTALASQHIRMT